MANIDLQTGVQKCDRRDKAAILVEARSYRPEVNPPDRQVLAGIQAQISGPTRRDPQRTDEKGRANFENLDSGSYQVTAAADGEMAELFEESSRTSDPTDVPTGTIKAFYFEFPYVWIEYQVKYQGLDKYAEGIGCKLRHRTKETWKPIEGVSRKEKVVFKQVPKGEYELALKLPHAANWRKDQDKADWAEAEVLVGAPIQLHASVSGFDRGAKAEFVIYDASDLSGEIHSEKVSVGDGEMTATWTPTAKELAKLKSGAVRFLARAGDLNTARTFSPPARVFRKEKVKVTDGKANVNNAEVTFYFSGGASRKETYAKGEGEVKIPWDEKVVRINVAHQGGARVAFDAGDGSPARRFFLG